MTIRAIEGQPGAQVVIISGPSGVGKDTIIEAMKRRQPEYPRRYVITVTTRQRRAYETDGVHYHFSSVEDYQRLVANEGLLEASLVHDHWYGTPRDQVQAAVSAGHDAILKIDVQGADKVRARIPDALLIFVVPPTIEELERRLRERRSETAEQLELRLRNAKIEMARTGEFDHVVVNETDKVDETAEAIDGIIAAEHRRYADRRIRV
ncbi:MAG: guanylate kinase [Candidatus Limnocylindrales bacterium]